MIFRNRPLITEPNPPIAQAMQPTHQENVSPEDHPSLPLPRPARFSGIPPPSAAGPHPRVRNPGLRGRRPFA